jgi:DNA repair protein RecO (recombination protein O)
MKYKTRSIVFNFIKFRESSIIARIYTEQYGFKNYIINNVRNIRPKYPVSFFQPLTQLDMVVYNKPESEINRVAEIKCINPYHSIPFDVMKSTVCLFLTEILYKILREEESNKALFDFLVKSFNFYDNSESHHSNFHLQFLIKLTNYLGINPINVNEIIRETKSSGSTYLISELEKKQFDELIHHTYQEYVEINRQGRKKMLTLILLFYQNHFDHLSEIKSYRILQEVFYPDN